MDGFNAETADINLKKGTSDLPVSGTEEKNIPNNGERECKESKADQPVLHLTTKLTDGTVAEIIDKLGIKPEWTEILRTFISGRFVYHTLSKSWISYSNARARFVFMESTGWTGWLAFGEGKIFLQAVNKTCFSLFQHPSEWRVKSVQATTSEEILQSSTIGISFIGLRLSVGCRVEAKDSYMLYTVKTIYDDEVHLTNNISSSDDGKMLNLRKKSFWLSKCLIFPHQFVAKVDLKTQKLFENTMGLGSRERLIMGRKFLYGEFTEAVPRIPALGVQLLKSVAFEKDDIGYQEAACVRLGYYWNNVARKVDFEKAEWWYRRAVKQFNNVSCMYSLALMAEKQNQWKQALQWYKEASIWGSNSAKVAIAEYAMSGRVGTPNFEQSFNIIQNLESTNGIPDDNSAKLLLVYLLDRNPMLKDGIKLSERFQINSELQSSIILKCIQYHLVKVILICQAAEERVTPTMLQTSIPSFLQIVKQPMKQIRETAEGKVMIWETRGYLAIDKLIYQCTLREKRSQIYDDFLLSNEKLARGAKLPTAVVFEIICSLYGLLGRPINYARAKLFMKLVRSNNRAILMFRSFVNSRNLLLMPFLPQHLVDLVLEYEFSLITKETPIWPCEESKKKICIALRRVEILQVDNIDRESESESIETDGI